MVSVQEQVDVGADVERRLDGEQVAQGRARQEGTEEGTGDVVGRQIGTQGPTPLVMRDDHADEGGDRPLPRQDAVAELGLVRDLGQDPAHEVGVAVGERDVPRRDLGEIVCGVVGRCRRPGTERRTRVAQRRGDRSGTGAAGGSAAATAGASASAQKP